MPSITEKSQRKGLHYWTKKCLSLTLAISLLVTTGFTGASAVSDSPDFQPQVSTDNTAANRTDNILTQDGLPNAHIVVPSGASQMEYYAAEELQTHVKLVSGATLPISTKDMEATDFSASLSPSAVSATEKGYYPVELTIKNPTDQSMLLTLTQDNPVPGMPTVTFRGSDDLEDGQIQLSPYSEVLVSGLVTVENPSAFGNYTLIVHVIHNGETLQSLPLQVSGLGSMLSNAGFESGDQGWTLDDSATVDSTQSHSGEASLKISGTSSPAYTDKLALQSGNLYSLSFWAKAEEAAEIYAKVSDLDGNDSALKVPMSLYTKADLGVRWNYYEFRFVANTSEDADYAASLLSFVCNSAGSIWIDDLSLVDCGTAPGNLMSNPGFENYTPGDTPTKFSPWYIGAEHCEPETVDYYTGSQSIKLLPSGNGGNYGYNTAIQTAPETTYTISFWAKSLSGTPVIKLSTSENVDGAWGNHPQSQQFQLTSEWSRYEFTFTTASGGDSYGGLWLNFTYSSGGLLMDHFSFISTQAVAAPDPGPDPETPVAQIPNAGFETADGWTLDSACAIDSTESHSGTSSLKVSGVSEPLFASELALESGQLYRLGFWAKADAAAQIYAKVNDQDAGGTSLTTPMSLYSKADLDTEWNYYEFRFIANTSVDNRYASSLLRLDCRSSGTVWIDDLSLINCGAAENLLSNGGFEQSTDSDNPLTRWEFFSRGSADTETKYSGNQSGKLTWSGTAPYQVGGYGGWLMGGADNTAYTFSFWAKAPNSTTSIRVSLPDTYLLDPNESVWDANNRESVENVNAVIPLSEEWTRYEITFIANKAGRDNFIGAWLSFFPEDSSGEDCCLWLDDVSLVNTQAATDAVIPDAPPDQEEDPTDPGQSEMPEMPEIPAPVVDNLSVIIATPDSFPELRNLFAEDLDWIGDSDGFAIRQNGSSIYIFGTCPEGALNGVYDFIEENMGVLWTRSEEIGLIYEPLSTIPVTKTGYREKSPFAVRGWHLCGTGKNRESHSDPATEIMMSRNKLNAKFAEFSNQNLWEWQASIGIEPFNLGHNISHWVVTSPSYDPNETEYWNTDAQGNPRPPHTGQVNFWSDLTAETIADSVIAFLGENDIDYVGVGINDTWECTTRPYDQQPFEYAPGAFVYPEDDDYLSTVFFTFLNKIARQVKAAYPDVTLTTYAYFFTEVPPRCDIEDNICIVFAPINEDVTEPINTTETSPNNKIFQNLENWKQKTRNLAFYNYYGCFTPSEYYERPIADRIQADLQYYAENGFLGLIPEGLVDANNNTWAMNTLTFWLYSKLAWNPYEDIEALTEEFCEKSYGAAAPYMLEYYRLVKQGWDSGKDSVDLVWNNTLDVYLQSFVLHTGLVDDMQQALDNAWAAANDTQKERIRYIKETFEQNIESSGLIENEDAVAVKTDAGKEAVLGALDFSDAIWADAPVLENFYVGADKRTVDGAPVKVRLLWDEDYLYIGYENFDNGIDDLKTTDQLGSSGSWWASESDDVETYLTTNPSGDYYAYFGNPSGLYFRYYDYGTGREHDTAQCDWETSVRIFDEEGTDRDRWVIIQAISFESLGVTGSATSDTDLYGYFYRGYYGPNGSFYNIGWNGASVWAPTYFRQIALTDGSEETVEKDELQNLYDQNKGKNNEGYTDGSWASFQKALSDAKAVLDNPNATQEEVDKAVQALVDAIAGLAKAESPAVDKSRLQRLYDSIRDRENDGFTAASWQTFDQARQNAKAVLDQPDATQEAVDSAYNRLLKAIVQLQKVDNGAEQKDKDFVIMAVANEGGSITPSGRIRVKAGSDKTFTITADEGYRIQKVLVDGEEVRLEENQYTFEDINAGHSIEAFFTKEKANVGTGARTAEIPLAAVGAVVLSVAMICKKQKA